MDRAGEWLTGIMSSCFLRKPPKEVHFHGVHSVWWAVSSCPKERISQQLFAAASLLWFWRRCEPDARAELGKALDVGTRRVVLWAVGGVYSAFGITLSSIIWFQHFCVGSLNSLFSSSYEEQKNKDIIIISTWNYLLRRSCACWVLI